MFFSVFFEPTDIARARVPFQVCPSDVPISFISPNIAEFVEIVREILPQISIREDDPLEKIADLACRVSEDFVDNVLVTLGSKGLLVSR